MKILITGSEGFIGKNLVCELENRGYESLFKFDRHTDPSLLDQYTKQCDFVFHLAGVNRPKEEKEFMEGNFGPSSTLLNSLIKNDNRCPILITSSVQAGIDNPYGKSKKASEDLFLRYKNETGADVYIYRLTNVFGKWCKPNYNSVIATFCHNIANDVPISISDPDIELTLIYIDDVVNEFINCMELKIGEAEKYSAVKPSYKQKLGYMANLIRKFKESRGSLLLPDFSDEFENKLYSTYLSYLPEDKFNYKLNMNIDERGSFTEFLKTEERGQVSVNVIKPGITKGNHWHHTKNEKFLVVSGEGLIRFRKVGTDKIIEYRVSESNLEVVDIPTGYTHSIKNIGKKDLVTVMWANEKFDKNKPDTYFLEV